MGNKMPCLECKNALWYFASPPKDQMEDTINASETIVFEEIGIEAEVLVDHPRIMSALSWVSRFVKERAHDVTTTDLNGVKRRQKALLSLKELLGNPILKGYFDAVALVAPKSSDIGDRCEYPTIVVVADLAEKAGGIAKTADAISATKAAGEPLGAEIIALREDALIPVRLNEVITAFFIKLGEEQDWDKTMIRPRTFLARRGASRLALISDPPLGGRREGLGVWLLSQESPPSLLANQLVGWVTDLGAAMLRLDMYRYHGEKVQDLICGLSSYVEWGRRENHPGATPETHTQQNLVSMLFDILSKACERIARVMFVDEVSIWTADMETEFVWCIGSSTRQSGAYNCVRSREEAERRGMPWLGHGITARQVLTSTEAPRPGTLLDFKPHSVTSHYQLAQQYDTSLKDKSIGGSTDDIGWLVQEHRKRYFASEYADDLPDAEDLKADPKCTPPNHPNCRNPWIWVAIPHPFPIQTCFVVRFRGNNIGEMWLSPNAREEISSKRQLAARSLADACFKIAVPWLRQNLLRWEKTAAQSVTRTLLADRSLTKTCMKLLEILMAEVVSIFVVDGAALRLNAWSFADCPQMSFPIGRDSSLLNSPYTGSKRNVENTAHAEFAMDEAFHMEVERRRILNPPRRDMAGPTDGIRKSNYSFYPLKVKEQDHVRVVGLLRVDGIMSIFAGLAKWMPGKSKGTPQGGSMQDLFVGYRPIEPPQFAGKPLLLELAEQIGIKLAEQLPSRGIVDEWSRKIEDLSKKGKENWTPADKILLQSLREEFQEIYQQPGAKTMLGATKRLSVSHNKLMRVFEEAKALDKDMVPWLLAKRKRGRPPSGSNN